MKDIGKRSLTAVFWGGGGAAARILLQLCTQIALARILGPEQYGLFAIGAIVVSFSNFFSDIGIAYGLIQKQEVNDADLRFVFTWQIIIGSLVTAAIAYFSLPIANFFGDVNAQRVVYALSVVCLLNALAAPSNNMLKRNLNFKSIQIAQLVGYIFGYIAVGLPLALMGAQVWALVTAWIVQALITLVLLYAAAKHPLKPLFWHLDSRTISQYGATVLITNVTNWMIGNIDRVIIARFFSPKEVGLYATSYNVLQSPTSALLGVLQPVFFSASSRISGDKNKILSGYYALISAIAIFLLPLFFSVSSISETFVLAVYGSNWIDAAAVFRPLALAMPLFLIWGMTTPLLWTTSSPTREFKAQFPIALLWIGVSWIAAHYSMTMVGWAVCAMFAMRCIVVIYTASKTLSLEWSRLWIVSRGGLFVAVACAISVTTIDWLLVPITQKNTLARLTLDALGGALVYYALLFKTPGLIPSELSEIIIRLAERCPANLAKRLHALTGTKAIHDSR
jgi:lipopolysaccharide exporter